MLLFDWKEKCYKKETQSAYTETFHLIHVVRCRLCLLLLEKNYLVKTYENLLSGLTSFTQVLTVRKDSHLSDDSHHTRSREFQRSQNATRLWKGQGTVVRALHSCCLWLSYLSNSFFKIKLGVHSLRLRCGSHTHAQFPEPSESWLDQQEPLNRAHLLWSVPWTRAYGTPGSATDSSAHCLCDCGQMFAPFCGSVSFTCQNRILNDRP